MRLLLDENLDWRLGRDLPGHQTESVSSLGWTGIQNGELLAKATEAGFDALVTMDSNMVHQQNIGGYPIALVALRAQTNRLGDTSSANASFARVAPKYQARYSDVSS
jgi:predicted nuclease of predicted toxin-antitoxin system